MPGIDTSIYSQLNQQQDPLAIPNKLMGFQQGALGLQNAQIQNELLRRQLGGQQAVQDALSAAVRPDGSYDLPTVSRLLANTPGAASGPDIAKNNIGIVGGNIANTGAAQNLSTAQLATIGQSYGATLQGGGSFGVKEARAGVLQALESGQITPTQANTLMHTMPRDDAGAKAWANGLFVRTLPSTGAGSVSTIGVTPSGAPVAGTPGQAVTKAVGATPPASTAPAPAAPAPSMGYVSGLAPGQAAASDISQQAAATQAANFEKAANAATDNKATIANMKDQLAKVATGPYADRINNAKAGYNELVDAAGLPLPQFNKDSIAAMDEFRKNAQILANQQFATLGGTGTDAQLNAAIHSNPGTYMSNLSNKQILQMLQGNQDAIEAKATAWRKYQQANGAAANFNTFSEDFNRNFAPRAFQFVHMSPSERSDMVKNMTPVEKSQLNSSLQTAMDRGWIAAPGQGQ